MDQQIKQFYLFHSWNISFYTTVASVFIADWSSHIKCLLFTVVKQSGYKLLVITYCYAPETPRSRNLTLTWLNRRCLCLRMQTDDMIVRVTKLQLVMTLTSSSKPSRNSAHGGADLILQSNQ